MCQLHKTCLVVAIDRCKSDRTRECVRKSQRIYVETLSTLVQVKCCNCFAMKPVNYDIVHRAFLPAAQHSSVLSLVVHVSCLSCLFLYSLHAYNFINYSRPSCLCTRTRHLTATDFFLHWSCFYLHCNFFSISMHYFCFNFSLSVNFFSGFSPVPANVTMICVHHTFLLGHLENLLRLIGA